MNTDGDATGPDGSARRALVAVAHPDDETIFFGHTIRSLARAGCEVVVACATGNFGDARLTSLRRAELRKACHLLGARPIQLELEDRRGPLDADAIGRALLGALGAEPFDAVYTHGAWGEYGHPHHTSVCRAVHRTFERVRSLAGPLRAHEGHVLDEDEMGAKRRIAASYASQPFAPAWSSGEERFVTLHADEAELLTDLAFGPRALPAAPRLRELVRQSLEGFGPDAPPFAELTGIPTYIFRPVHAARAAMLAPLLDAF